jgi:predicted membrane protein
MNELYFVLQVITFSYVLFWIYLTFREAQLLLGLATVAAAYVIFVHGLSVTLLAAFFLLFVVMGTHLQMFVQFGVMPLLGYQHGGNKFVKEGEAQAQQEMAQLQQAVESGQITAEQARAEMQRIQGEHNTEMSKMRMLQ